MKLPYSPLGPRWHTPCIPSGRRDKELCGCRRAVNRVRRPTAFAVGRLFFGAPIGMLPESSVREAQVTDRDSIADPARAPRALVVFNPRAGGGRAARFRVGLREALERSPTRTEWVETQGPGHAEAIVRERRDAFDRVVAVGGDGTVHEVVNGLLDAASDVPTSRVGFGVVHGGTGGDFARGLGIPRRWSTQLEVALSAELRPIDVLSVELAGPDGIPRRRFSVNIAGAGMNGRVVELANRSDKRWGGLATFAMATVQAVAERRMVDAELKWTDAEGASRVWQGRLAASFFANGPYCGHGMYLGKGGSLGDGLLDITLIPELPPMYMLLRVPRLYRGTIDSVPEVLRAQASVLTLSSPEPDVMVDLDGELAGRLPLKIRVLPKAVLCAAGSTDL